MSTAPNLPAGFPAMSIEQAHKLLVSAPASPFEIEERVIRGVKIKTWKNAPPSLAAVFEASVPFGPRVYMVNDDERVTFDAHRRAVSVFAKRLVADGVKKGDRVAIIMRNLPEWSVAFWAAILAGAIVTPLNAWWTGPELEYGLTDSGTTLAIADAERWERIREHADNCPDLKRIYVSRSSDEISDPRVIRLEEIIGAPNSWASLTEVAMPEVTFEPEDDATIFYTSGTTGKPKGAVITHRNIISNFFNAMCAQARSFLRRGEALPVPDPTVQKVESDLGAVLPCDRMFRGDVSRRCLAGSKLVMQRRWNADQALELIEREKITHGRRRADDRVADHRASAFSRIRSVVAGDDFLWRRAVGAGTGAAHEGALSQSEAGARLGHDGDVGDGDEQLRRGLRAQAVELRRALAHRRNSHRRR